MQIDQLLTDSAVLSELGGRLRARRLERDWSQSELADRAGTGLTTVQKLESGRDTQLTSAIKVLRALGLVERLDDLVPEPTPGPIVRREMQELASKHARRRASRRGGKRGGGSRGGGAGRPGGGLPDGGGQTDGGLPDGGGESGAGR